MSSAAVTQALANDPELNAMGISFENIFSDYAMEEVPYRGKFIILRWGMQNATPVINGGPESLTVWVHQPDEMGSDYGEIKKILIRCREVLLGLEHELGEDGFSVTSVRFEGEGGNMNDPGFHTITRNALFQVLLRVAV